MVWEIVFFVWLFFVSHVVSSLFAFTCSIKLFFLFIKYHLLPALHFSASEYVQLLIRVGKYSNIYEIFEETIFFTEAYKTGELQELLEKAMCS